MPDDVVGVVFWKDRAVMLRLLEVALLIATAYFAYKSSENAKDAKESAASADFRAGAVEVEVQKTRYLMMGRVGKGE